MFWTFFCFFCNQLWISFWELLKQVYRFIILINIDYEESGLRHFSTQPIEHEIIRYYELGLGTVYTGRKFMSVWVCFSWFILTEIRYVRAALQRTSFQLVQTKLRINKFANDHDFTHSYWPGLKVRFRVPIISIYLFCSIQETQYNNASKQITLQDTFEV